LTQNTSILLIVATFIIIILILLLINNRKKSTHRQMVAILKPYIQDEIKNIIIPDGIGGLLEIEHLILMEHGLLLIETYPMSGNMFGAETIEQWTQLIAGRSYKFANPLRHIRTSRQALKELAPNIPIFCRVVFNADSIFPKGKPEEVSVLSSLSDDLSHLKSSAIKMDRTSPVWQLIMRIARKDGQAVQRDGEL
tara:strand:- start:4863 stop:5447 length:585 start_codon:yes stop_codon:yes gene_type:complete